MNLGMIGLGTVGSSVFKRIEESKEEMQRLLKARLDVVCILVKDRDKGRKGKGELLTTTDWELFSEACTYDVVFEAMNGVDPAYTYTKALLTRGTAVVTANKKLVSEHGEELEELAQMHGTYYSYDACVAGAIPIVSALKSTLATTDVARISGILNGSTNYMLTEMTEHGRSYSEVLKEAQQLGYAEEDPTADVSGYDAWYKIRILSKLAFGSWPQEEAIGRTGLESLHHWQVQIAREHGFSMKLVAEAECDTNGKPVGRVGVALVHRSHPFYSVSGVTNGVLVEGEDIGELLFTGPGAGGAATANSVVEDFVLHERASYLRRSPRATPWSEREAKQQYAVFSSREDVSAVKHSLGERGITIHVARSYEEGALFVIEAERTSHLPYPLYRIYGEFEKQMEHTH
ncbi:homoserine dehydrogenase [Shouchella shacheensis]|uniref:homoserine dehydrogenase n=1 Tax=Shouchella shacheensis TaxID=1649580 RepID=UPI000740331B|nr:homoserine dehydrogenase [Shouchella shacheensis]